MPIQWKKLVRNPETQREEWVDDGVTHVGLVMGPITTNEERVMSDVYCDVSRVLVWNATEGRTESVWISSNFENDTRHGTATVDIDPDILDAYKKKQAALAEEGRVKELARREAEAEERAREEICQIRYGAEVVVSNKNSRKVAPGTRGVVFTIKDSDFGPKVGFKDKDGNVHWTAQSNLSAVYPGIGHDQKPVGGWQALRDAVVKAKSDWAKSFPVMGTKVRIVSSGVEGVVRWMQDSRIGVLRTGAPRSEKYTFVNVWEVDVLRPDGTTYRVNSFAPVVTAIPEDGQVRENPLKDYPVPFCNIVKVTKRNGEWATYTNDGSFLMVVPEETALELRALLGS